MKIENRKVTLINNSRMGEGLGKARQEDTLSF